MATAEKESPKTKPKPPFGAVGWYVNFFETLGRIKIEKVDNTFLTTNGIVSSGNVYKVINGLRFLDLINEDGSATERMKSISVVGVDYQKNFEKMVRDAYTILFDKVKNLEKALAEDVINCLRVNYAMAPSTAKQGAQIFVFLAQKAGISLSESIVKGLAVSEERMKPARVTTRKPRKTEKAKPEGTEESIQERLPEEALGRFTLKGVGYVDIKDEDTFGIAKAYFKVLAKKLGITKEEESRN